MFEVNTIFLWGSQFWLQATYQVAAGERSSPGTG